MNVRAAGLLLYGRALGLSHSESEDVLQETFLALLQLPQRAGGPNITASAPFANRALNFRRSLWRRLGPRMGIGPLVLKAIRPADEAGAEAEAVRRMAALPANNGKVIILKIWNGMTFGRHRTASWMCRQHRGGPLPLRH